MTARRDWRRHKAHGGATMAALSRLYGGPRRREGLRRDLLPAPEQFYAERLKLLPGRGPWRSASCCFHADKTPSLRVNVETGAFRCFGCGAKGRDVVAFTEKVHDVGFVDAARLLGAWGTL